MQTSARTISIAFDTSVVIGLANPEVDLLSKITAYFLQTNHRIVMSEANVAECNLAIKRALNTSTCFEVIQRNACSQDFQLVKQTCKTSNIHVQDNDYYCIAAAVYSNCFAVVSNDIKQIEAAQEYSKQKKLTIKVWTPASFLYYLYETHKDIFPWQFNIKSLVRYFQHIEIENIFDGFKNRHWTEKDGRSRFTPYATTIYATVDSVHTP